MALYAIGDFHLSLAKEKPMDIFGEIWHNHPDKLKASFAGLKEEDVSVLCGDLSWGMSLQESLPDFKFVEALPGKKLILKGNHDYWWNTASKINSFFQENGLNSLSILHNNCYFYGDCALCGTRGWFYEEEKGGEHDKKIMLREIGRLETSLKAAGDREKIVFLHYPPIYQHYKCAEILELLRAHSVRLCLYGHIHGRAMQYAFNGWYGGTEFRLVSADYLNFKPIKIKD